MGIEPILLAWLLASVNFITALWSLTVAQRKAFLPSMILVFGGGGLRMLAMIIAVIAIMLKKTAWMAPFCTVLLACFISYLIVEIAVIHKLGLLQQR